MALYKAPQYQQESDVGLGRASGGAQSMLDMGSGFMSDYMNTFSPMGSQLAGAASGDTTGADIDTAATDVGLAYDKSRQIMDRNMSRMGVSPNAGKFRGLQQQWGLARAAAEAGAKTRARRTAEGGRFDRILQAFRSGQNLPGMALSALQAGTSASRGVSRDYGEIAGEKAALDAQPSYMDKMFKWQREQPRAEYTPMETRQVGTTFGGQRPTMRTSQPVETPQSRAASQQWTSRMPMNTSGGF